MATRPRRSAAARANESISVHARWADTSDRFDRRSAMTSRRSRRASGAGIARDMLSSSPDESVTVQTSRSTRGANRKSDRLDGTEIVHGTRNRGGRKNYVVDSSPDDEDVDDAQAGGVDEADEDAEGDEMEVDAEGEDVDAEGEEDAESDVDMDASVTARAGHTIRVSQTAPRSAARAAAAKMAVNDEDEEDEEDEEEEEEEEDEEDEDEDEDEDDLSDPAESDDADQTVGFGDEIMADEDAEGEEIEVAGEPDEDEDEEEEEDEDAEGEEEIGVDAEADSEEGSQAESPDLTKMTKRQRARFEDGPQEYMKLSDEVQVKKHFTAEELSMRRQEMARRRRNLSEKRTEEVKMETINKLLKKQAPKINRKAAAAAARADSPDEEVKKPNPILIRWINNRNGSKVSVPEDVLASPAGSVFSRNSGLSSGKVVEEVS